MSDPTTPQITLCGQDTENKIRTFEQADFDFKTAYEQFERTNEAAIARLDTLRDERNAKLDEARRAIRADTEISDEMRATFNIGMFKVQKKWSDFYIPDKLKAMLMAYGLYEDAVANKIIETKVIPANYFVVRKYLEDRGLLKQFECCEDGKEDCVAISGPKSVPPFGSELKKE